MNYTLRACEPEDLEAVVDLCAKHAAHEQCRFSPEGKTTKLYAALFSEHPLLNCWVVVSEKIVVGYCTFTFDYSTWDASSFLYLDCLYLEPSFRSQGIGQIILDKLKSAAIQKGCTALQWQTPDFNEKAIQFYNRAGASGKKKMRFTLTTGLSDEVNYNLESGT